MYKTHREIKRKKRIKTGLFSLLVIVIIWFTLGLILKLTITKNEKLEKIGYSNIEIDIINQILNKKEKKIIYKYDYINFLAELLIDKDFNKDKLIDYLNYHEKYPNVTIKDLLYIINNNHEEIEYNEFNKKLVLEDNYNPEKLNRYQEYNKKYNLSIEDTIDAVNKDFDKYDIKYNTEYLKFLNKDYTIIKNLERYNSYYKNNNKNIDEIISEVNCNLDLKPYEEYKNANIDDSEKILVNKYYKLDKSYEAYVKKVHTSFWQLNNEDPMVVLKRIDK